MIECLLRERIADISGQPKDRSGVDIYSCVHGNYGSGALPVHQAASRKPPSDSDHVVRKAEIGSRYYLAVGVGIEATQDFPEERLRSPQVWHQKVLRVITAQDRLSHAHLN